ncbi:acetyl-CoA C-acyltransferase family protein [Pelistega europaea]|uniref:Acetyl-CoA C-acyltransferase family protein n=1 Tax=Pelistega europaea TaxID=106147 RepID=A0A7Y4LAQ9_9BURK|nr:acetyl-CoA C-acyltransferase family protein [Pelistega europaea]NOL48952.1 acetyl-CoA C-acyltransferase family protein [Pelistega europaea]
MTTEVYVVSAMRTAIGSFGGSLKDFAPHQMATAVMKEAMQKAGVSGKDINHVVMGQVISGEPSDIYLSRVASVNAGVSIETPAFNVNRLCGSGLQAIVSASQAIMLGDADIALAGGAESMSRAPYIVPAMRFGARMGDAQMQDMMLSALHDPFQHIHMGVTAENVACQFHISREEQDQLAYESHVRALNAIDKGYFREQIVPMVLKTRKGEVVFDTDEHPRRDISLAGLAKLKPVFLKENGTVTSGNASGINDGAGALVLMSGKAVKERDVKPLARLVAYAHAGVEPSIMGIGPVPATRLALKKAGLTVQDMDVIESNEAFAAQALAVAKELGFDPAKVNPNGSGVSLGHPVGATGAIITTKALYELHRIQGRYALVTMCIGGGQGIAAIFERV